jgi:hypothetical protein
MNYSDLLRNESTVLSMVERVADLRRRLRREGIEIVPLKGLDLVLRAYPFAGLRPMGDVDLLVRPHHLPRIGQLLERHGYTRRPDVHLSCISRDRALRLDIRSSIWFLPSTAPIWNRLVSVDYQGEEWRLLNPEDSLLYRVAHAAMQRQRLVPILAQDLRVLLWKCGSRIDWEAWCRRVRKLGLAVWVRHALDYAVGRGVDSIPPLVLHRLRPIDDWERRLQRWVRSRVTEQPRAGTDYRLVWLAHPGFRPRLRFLRETFLPSPEEYEMRFGGSGNYVANLLRRSVRIAARTLGIGL